MLLRAERLRKVAGMADLLEGVFIDALLASMLHELQQCLLVAKGPPLAPSQDMLIRLASGRQLW